MAFNRSIWLQLKNLTIERLIHALEVDGWALDTQKRSGARLAYLKEGNRVVLHYHPKKTFQEKLLKQLLADIGWTDVDLKRLRLIK